MDELSSPAAVIEITNAVRWGLKLTPRMRKVLISLVVSLVSVSSLHGQSAAPAGQPPPPRAIYTPKPVYRPAWTKQGRTGKGNVLCMWDKKEGKQIRSS